RHFFDYPISRQWSTLRNMGLITTLRAGFSYLFSCVRKLPETSLENFYINRFGRVLYSMFFESSTEKVWGRHPYKISADWGAQRVKGLSIRAILKDIFRRLLGTGGEVETSLIERFFYPKLGPGQLWELAAAEVKALGGEIKMNCPVTALEARDGRIVALRCEEAGEERRLTPDAVFSSMPVRELMDDLSGAEVPKAVKEAADTLPYRDFITVGLLVKDLLIRNDTKRRTVKNRVPDCWIYVQDKDVKLGRVQIFNNWSPYMVKDPENTVWMGLEYFCDEGDELWSKTDGELIDLAKGEIERIGIARSADVLDAHAERIKKAYPAYFDGYAHMDAIVRFLDGFENLYCIGRNGQHRYNNMDHSMATAFAAVEILERGGGDKTALWQVNTEQSYHEEKEAGR
ncbi:MAG: NAD(P)/FAD-dependent oxidoreductase, partial [Clostridia bacterium]|nr:NAD(P)/FAD-dependent oxidoreductase [Clostridia bacterium]